MTSTLDDARKAHKVMTPAEYVATPIIGWHEVCRDVDGFGGVGVRFLGTSAPLDDARGELLALADYIAKGDYASLDDLGTRNIALIVAALRGVSSGAPSDKQFNADRTDDMALSSADRGTPDG